MQSFDLNLRFDAVIALNMVAIKANTERAFSVVKTTLKKRQCAAILLSMQEDFE